MNPGAASLGGGPERILRLAQGYLSTALLIAALDLGVFDRIAAGERSVEAMAAATGADPRGLRILLDALCAIGLVVSTADGYELAPLTDSHLVSGRTAYIGGVIRAYVDNATWTSVGLLAEAVRQGGGALAPDDTAEARRRSARTAAELATVSNPAALALLEAVTPQSGAARVLEIVDVGCGNSALGQFIAASTPGSTVTCVDWEEVLVTARETAGKLGTLGRTRFVAGDMFEVPLGGPYDLAILSQVLHSVSEEDAVVLLRRLASTLSGRGRLAIHDYMADVASPREEPGPYLFSAILLARTARGEARTVDKHRELLAAAGCRIVDTVAVRGLPTRLIIARPAGQFGKR